MEKILLVLNAHKPDIASIDFACRMSVLAQTRLAGLFIENLHTEYIPSGRYDGPYFYDTTLQANSAETITADRDQAIRIFKDECRKHDVQPDVYVDQGDPAWEVIRESRFADLLIVDPEMSFYDGVENLPSHFIKEILTRSECPVLLTPKEFEGVDEIVFCYDEKAASVFAIKQFTYLFPEFSNKKLVVLEVNKSWDSGTEDLQRLMDWLKAHYSTVSFIELKGDPKEELFAHFFMKKKKIIVMGAYGRSLLNQFFRRSSAELLVRMVDLPLFISHL